MKEAHEYIKQGVTETGFIYICHTPKGIYFNYNLATETNDLLRAALDARLFLLEILIEEIKQTKHEK